jgi:hypothetical protein
MYAIILKKIRQSVKIIKGGFYEENKTCYQASHGAYPEEYERAMTGFERL